MEIDIKTVVLIIGITRLMQVFVFYHQYRATPNLRGPGWWVIWSASDFIGSMIVLLRSDPALLPFVMIIQNVIFAAGSIFVYVGIRSFFNKEVNLKLIFLAIICYELLHLFFLYVVDDTNIRTIILYTVVSVSSFLVAFTVYKNRSRSINLTANLNIIIFIVHGVIYGIRVVMILMGIPSPRMLAPDNLNYLIYFDALIVGLLWTFGFVIMLNQRLNSEISEAKSHVEDKNEELKKTNIEKDKFFSIIAHDLRSPFMGFLGLTEIMAEDVNSLSKDEISKMSKELNRNANNLFNLLKNLLEWAQMQRGATSFNPGEIDLYAVTSQNIELIIRRAEQKRIEITNEIAENQIVYADESMLDSILRNLLANAVKFTESGGKIKIGSNGLDGKTIEIFVMDTGVGMSHSLSGKLFKIEEKVGRKGTDGEESTGLGLLLCKEFVEKHGGKIWVESEEGRGSVFYFTIPANKPG